MKHEWNFLLIAETKWNSKVHLTSACTRGLLVQMVWVRSTVYNQQADWNAHMFCCLMGHCNMFLLWSSKQHVLGGTVCYKIISCHLMQVMHGQHQTSMVIESYKFLDVQLNSRLSWKWISEAADRANDFLSLYVACCGPSMCADNN